MNEERLNLVLEEIKKNNEEGLIDFVLIVSGSKCKKFMDLLGDNKNIFKNGCIYTTNYDKYQQIKKVYDIIENVYTEPDEIISFINDNKSNTNIFKIYKLINIYNYIDNYYFFHKLIAEKYDKKILENSSTYEFSIALLNDININGFRHINIFSTSLYAK